MQRVVKITIYTAILSFVLAGVAFAHTDSDTANPMEQMMRQMMGDRTFETMEKMEDQMMGEENHARMEELTNRMLAGNLSPDEQNEMTQMMQDKTAGTGMMTMMMSMMMPQMMQNAGFSGPGGMMGFSNTGNSVYWITVILIWAVLVLAIIALIKWLTKK
jgi:hypothetical protein